MPRWIRRLSPDIVHLHHPCPMAFAACLLARLPAPVVVGYHNDVVKPRSLIRFFAPLQNAVLRRASAILVGTEDYRDTSPHLAPFLSKCSVVPYGIPLPPLSLTPEVEKQAGHIRSAHSGSLLLFVGRLCYYKGLEVAIKAMAEVDGTLLIVGTGPLEQALRGRIRDLSLTDKVVLVGPVDDSALAAHLHCCDLLVLPSTYRSEAFGLVMLQAHACARPVICSDLPGLSTVNPDRKTGLLVPAGDASALAEAIRVLLGDTALRERMGQHARRRVEALYSVDLMRQRIERVYDQLAV
jgi:rhamnosyl/mannosyltransferase